MRNATYPTEIRLRAWRGAGVIRTMTIVGPFAPTATDGVLTDPQSVR